jgi:hypothetical protein
MKNTKSKNKIVYHFRTCAWGEMEGMFDESGKMLGSWCLNDAHWRGEYMEGFLEKLGIVVKDLPNKFKTKALEQIADCYGFDMNEAESEE